MKKYSFSSELATLFKPWIIRRPSGEYQVLFPLTELDNIVDKMIKIYIEHPSKNVTPKK